MWCCQFIGRVAASDGPVCTLSYVCLVGEVSGEVGVVKVTGCGRWCYKLGRRALVDERRSPGKLSRSQSTSGSFTWMRCDKTPNASTINQLLVNKLSLHRDTEPVALDGLINFQSILQPVNPAEL
jgi:hypothetical protein